MGFNTTVVILNDAAHYIEDDPDFGKNLVHAMRRLDYDGDGNVPAGNHCNAAQVVETHHADGNVLVAVGGNRGNRLEGGYASCNLSAEASAVTILKQLGYVVYKKKSK